MNLADFDSNIGLVFQAYNFNSVLTAKENVEFIDAGDSATDRKSRAENAVIYQIK